MFRRPAKLILLTVASAALFCFEACTKLCSCSESEADAAAMAIARGIDPRVTKVTLEKNSPIFGDDEFTVTMEIQNQNPIVSKGTFSQSGDSITFKVTNGVSALIMPGEYKLTCSERDGRKVITVQRKNPAGPPLTFVCH